MRANFDKEEILINSGTTIFVEKRTRGSFSTKYTCSKCGFNGNTYE
jgi:hypothetical protein